MRTVGRGGRLWRFELVLGEGSGCGGVVVGTTNRDAAGEEGEETGTPLELGLGITSSPVDGAGGTGDGSFLSARSAASIDTIAIGRPMIATTAEI
nr:hypothetical protein [uncultured Actinoplanes sp.]